MIETVRTFTALSEEFVELFMKHHPVAATEAGIHDYDHVLPDDSPDGLKARAVWLRDLDQRLVASVPWEELPLEPRIDFALLRSRIAALRADLEEIKVPQRYPGVYLERALNAVHLLLARSFAPLDERKEAAVARLMAIPDYLEAVKPNLQQVAPELLAASLTIAAQGPTFVDEVVRTLLRQFPGEAERLEHAGNRARSGFLRFHDWMEKELKPRAGGTFAIGERWMNYKLEREHMVPYSCAELEKVGREHVAHALVLLEDEAKRHDPRRTWRQLIDDGRKRAPESHWLREAYVTEVERTRRFVSERKIVPIPSGERLEILDTPVFERALRPYAVYQAPAPFDAETAGVLYVTPIDIRRSKDEQAAQLAAHCTPALPILALHEGYPGHHLQLTHANRAGSRLRRIMHSDVLAEGWALYCEELMWEQGYFTADPLTRLFQLRDLLFRACRVVLDAALHSGRMTPQQAVDYLVEQAMLDPTLAASEVSRYCTTPTQPMSYLVGKLQILELRSEAQHKLGARFQLHDFHAALLASGTIPPALVREELWSRLGVS
ncbi:MAG TPA: DUF885 domain-containing protein [Methylomirabilota bacterium]|jgi:hypothetical protein|nr:DUF885 domain-containing protein [Methylomirabilota bacterium]